MFLQDYQLENNIKDGQQVQNSKYFTDSKGVHKLDKKIQLSEHSIITINNHTLRVTGELWRIQQRNTNTPEMTEYQIWSMVAISKVI